MKIPDLKETDIELLEKEMDRMNETVPVNEELHSPRWPSHIIPSAYCPLCLPAGREMLVRLEQKDKEAQPVIIKYLNRLSDYLFVLSRYTGHQMNVEEFHGKQEYDGIYPLEFS